MDFPLLLQQLGPVVKILATALGFFTLALSLGFCWYQWRMIRKLRSFPSKFWHLKIGKLVLEAYRKNVPFTDAVFRLILNTAKEFRSEGLCVAWIVKPYLIVYSEKHMKYLVNERNLLDKASVTELMFLFFGNGLITSPSDVWRVHRKWLNPAFHVALNKGKMGVLNEHARQLAQKIETMVDRPVDGIFEVLMQYTLQSSTDYLFDLNYDSEKHQHLAETGIRLADIGSSQFVERLMRPWIQYDFLLPFFPSGRKVLKAVNEIHRCIRLVIQELKEKEHTMSETNCWTILSSRQDSLSEREVLDHVVNLMAGAFDTVSTALLFCFYLLGHHPEIQEKAYDEVMSVAPGGDLTYDNLSDLKYLDCVIKETLRMYPPIPIISRRASESIQCGDYTIPKGTEVAFFIFMLHRDPEVFPDPDRFDPERFRDSSAVRPWMYIPFSEGYRNCIGKRIAMAQMKIQLSHVLSRFQITSLSRLDVDELRWSIVLKPPEPLRFLFRHRNQVANDDV